MSVNPSRVTSNTAWYMIALTLQKVISFVYFTLLARYLGPEDIGKYFFATSYVLIFAVFADLGMSAIATREVAKGGEGVDKLFNQIISFKIVTSLFVVVALAIISPLLIHDLTTAILIIVAAIAMILDGFTLIFYSGIRGKQNLGYESFATLLHQAIILIIGLILIKLHFPVQVLIIALVAASLFNFIYSWWVARRKIGFHLHWTWNQDLLRQLWTLIVPFALAAIFTRLYAYTDSVLLRLMQGSTEVGYYSVAYKITFAFQFIPLAFVAALYPAFAYYWHNDKEQLAATFSRSIQYLLLVAAPISFGLIAAAPYVVPHIYTGAFSNTVLPLQILITNLPFLFINFPLGSLLNAINQQKAQTLIVAAGLIWNVTTNLILIPHYGARGAAAASTTSTVLVFILSLVVLNRHLAYNRLKTLIMAVKTLIMALLMAILVLFLAQYVNIYLTIGFAGLSYVLGIWLLGLLKPADLRTLLTSLKR
ncbi:MAG: flippase [Candidatus Komeilibacteria bacterium]